MKLNNNWGIRKQLDMAAFYANTLQRRFGAEEELLAWNKNRVFSGISQIHWTMGRCTFSLGFRYLPWNMMEFRVSDAKIHSFHTRALSVELGQARCRDAVNAEGLRPSSRQV